MSRHVVIPAVYLILKDSSDRFCLTRRFNTGYMDGFYSLPAGHVEKGEGLVSAMIREAKEEVGVTVTSENLSLVHVSMNLECDPERLEFFFVCTNWEGEVSIQEPDKCDDIAWYGIDEVPQNTTNVVKNALRQSPMGQAYSEQKS
jgi:8-oxo-dGTP diphosphatase